MSIFGRIRDAIFGGEASSVEAPGHAASPATTGDSDADASIPAPSRPRRTTLFNAENSFDSMPGADRLDWRTSIVDLMDLIGVESDYESRKALAAEMGRADYSGSVEDNVWLHQRVMRELADNRRETAESLR